jgi:RNA polymerase sigma-70 factor (ECF subfamily)
LGAIDELPPWLREPVRLHYYQEKSYLEIALELGISYGNVRKRMSQARAILKEKLSGFVGEEDGVPPEPRKGRKSEKGSLRAPAVGESLQGVLPAESGEPVGAVLSVLQGEPAFEEACFEGELGIVAGGEPIAVFSGMKYASITRKGGGHGGHWCQLKQYASGA